MPSAHVADAETEAVTAAGELCVCENVCVCVLAPFRVCVCVCARARPRARAVYSACFMCNRSVYVQVPVRVHV